MYINYNAGNVYNVAWVQGQDSEVQGDHDLQSRMILF